MERYKDYDKEYGPPDCCQMGSKYIVWTDRGKRVYRDAFLGWGLMVDYSCDSQEVEQVFYCPFCGKKLEAMND